MVQDFFFVILIVIDREMSLLKRERERSEPHAQGEERRKGSFLISVQKKSRRENERVRQVENGLFFFPPPVKKERREESSHLSRASIAAD